MNSLNPIDIRRIFIVVTLTVIFRGIFVLNASIHHELAFATWPDTWEYETVGWNLASGKGYTLHETPPYLPEMIVTPAYPFILAGVYRLVGREPAIPLVLNLLFAVASAVLIFLIARRLTDSGRAAFWSGVLFAVNPNAALYTGQLLAETFYIMLILLGFLIAMECDADRPSTVFVSGVVLGLLVLTKPSGVVPAAFIVLYGILRSRRWHYLLTPLIAFVITLPWFYRNLKAFGMWKFSSVMDMTLTIYHAAPVMSDIEDMPLDSAAMKLLGYELYEKVASRYPDPVALDSAGRIAKSFLKAHPLNYLKLTLTGIPVVVGMPMSMAEYARFLGRAPSRAPVAQDFIRAVSRLRVWDALKLIYERRLSVLSPVGAFGYLYGALFNLIFLLLTFVGWLKFPERRFATVLLFLTLFVLIPVGICPSPRYRLPVSVVWSVFAGYGITLIKKEGR